MTDGVIKKPAPPKLNIDYSLRLPADQYVRQETGKSAVVLHHTVGGSAKSTYDWWLDDPRRIATAYIIERNGVIYEVFDPKYWAWHLGVSNPTTERRTIGIEMASEGGLTREGNWLYAFDGKKKLYNIFSDQDKFYDNGTEWRGFRYFDQYEDEQFESLWKLCITLGVQFSIPWRTPKDHEEFNLRKYIDFKGFLSHTHLRRDKSDVHRGFPWDEFVRLVDLELV